MGKRGDTERKERRRAIGSLTFCETSSDLVILLEKSFLGISSSCIEFSVLLCMLEYPSEEKYNGIENTLK